ncbi:hypothetical protein L484_005404 [Morus notabilis]|uniref:Uncharacterized protein n=1 Tax=Morus notabilis TaxID=981085 RepID=W9S3Q2_9ROSA|nr:hypothetical protein L484_005404 [Morus notabilis]
MDGFSSSRCTESIGTEIISIGGRMTEISRREEIGIFGTSAGVATDSGGVRGRAVCR